MGIKEDMKEWAAMEANFVEGECNCGLAKSLNGEGCRYCQPQEYIDRLHEMIEEEEEYKLQAIIEKQKGQIAKMAFHFGEVHGTCFKVINGLHKDG